ncbi:MAG: low molecular weight protein arginine phosphatase [Gemmatimonadota bacterium]
MKDADRPHPDPKRPPSHQGEAGEAFRLLFVCTGNTCRSPLAEALTQRALVRLGWRQVEVRSAGVLATVGAPASEGSLRAGARHGLDLSTHRSVQVTEELVAWADLILTMSASHLLAVSAYGGEERASVITDFVGGDAEGRGIGVVDPHGGDDALYEETLIEIEGLVDHALTKLAPLVAP